MTETTSSVIPNELQECFNDLKKHSLSFKLGSIQETAGDEVQNPLHKQFTLLLSKIEEILVNHNKETDDYVTVISMKASIIYEKAKILLAENSLQESKELLREALKLVEEYSEHPKVAFLHRRIVNHLTYVLSRIGELEEAKELLIIAIENESKCTPEVFSTDDLFLNTKKEPKLASSKLHRLTINNMQMLAWVYARLGDIDGNLRLQHDILQKQLDLGDGDVCRWAESCFRLAGMFVARNDWENARYHLAAAESVLSPLEACLVPNPEIFILQADLARSWVYYGLQLFEASRKPKCLKTLENEDAGVLSGEKSDGLVVKPAYIFNGLQVDVPKIPCSEIEDLQQAKLIFAAMQTWIKRARLFYTLRDYPLQYVNLCLDLSELYRFVALYEEDIESEYAVQKKRYDALETLNAILKEVRPSCYVAVNMELTKEIIEVQMELMNLNLRRICTPAQVPRNDIPENSLKKKMNALSFLHSKLEAVTSTLNTSTPISETKRVEVPELGENHVEESSQNSNLENDSESNLKEMNED